MAIQSALAGTIEAAGITPEELAERAGLEPETVTRILAEDFSSIRLTTLDALCAALECQPDAVLRWVPDSPQ